MRRRVLCRLSTLVFGLGNMTRTDSHVLILIELSANNARDGCVNKQAVFNEHLNDSLLVRVELLLDDLHVV